jgi:hypothetical protein
MELPPPEMQWEYAIDKLRNIDSDLVGVMEDAWSAMCDKVKRETIENHARVVRAVSEGTYRIIDEDEEPPRHDGSLIVLIPRPMRGRGAGKRSPRSRRANQADPVDEVDIADLVN